MTSPARSALFTIGTVLQLLKLPDGTVKVLVEGGQRARIKRFAENPSFFQADAETIPENAGTQQETEAFDRRRRTIVSLLREIPGVACPEPQRPRCWSPATVWRPGWHGSSSR